MGLERRGNPGEAPGTLHAEQDAGGSADAPSVHCWFGLQKHATGAVLAFAVRPFAAVAVQSRWLTLIQGADSAVTGSCVGGEPAMGFAPVVARAESALRSLPQNNRDQASLALTWLITLY